MFTGIVQEIGKVTNVSPVGGGLRLTIAAASVAKDLSVDDSISVNGVCQTVIRKQGELFDVLAIEETLLKTTLGAYTKDAIVNLELAAKLGDRLGGHLVSGHVDCVGTIESIQRLETSWNIRINIPSEFERYVIPVGSIAVDGVSLTVAGLKGNQVTLAIIPHTMEKTIFSSYRVGSYVNLELDMIGKYIERLMGARRGKAENESISFDQLSQWGYEP